ncbi:type I CRISPR-associated protein Cas7 [Melioribacter sp. OK-6-Me]|uniref:type I CRISPR-associated protein Cas7 n=1 Tax=unclassified Melioribacter TaxID=2627329 RepID=UPI003EDAB269
MLNTTNNPTFNRVTGLLVIEVINSNPNGDPDKESDPRQRNDLRGEISPVSFKRKLRDLIEDKKGEVWINISKNLNLNNGEFHYSILESRGRDRNEIIRMIKEDEDKFKKEYWDARVFGNTFLEEGSSTSIKTGVVQFGLGVSISPILIERHTTTNKAGVEEGKDRGMAPLSYRIVQHGLYCLPFFINPSVAYKTGCTYQDIELLTKVIPYAYTNTSSYIRSQVNIIHAWYIEHNSPLGSCSDFELIKDLTPYRLKKEDSEKPSTSIEDYYIPTEKDIREELKKKVKSVRDLMKEI